MNLFHCSFKYAFNFIYYLLNTCVYFSLFLIVTISKCQIHLQWRRNGNSVRVLLQKKDEQFCLIWLKSGKKDFFFFCFKLENLLLIEGFIVILIICKKTCKNIICILTIFFFFFNLIILNVRDGQTAHLIVLCTLQKHKRYCFKCP